MNAEFQQARVRRPRAADPLRSLRGLGNRRRADAVWAGDPELLAHRINKRRGSARSSLVPSNASPAC